jgi:hypothetical protein
MIKFGNQAYDSLITELLNDAVYLEGRSNRGIISTVRQYTEVVVRRILDLEPNASMTLGKSDVSSALKAISNNNELLLSAVENIRVLGNKCTHTQELGPITDEDVSNIFDCLFDLYAYLFVNFFTKHRFGQNGEILSSFSILPPIIRYKTLKNLYELDPKNLNVIDKYTLAILKAFDEHEAKAWIMERKEELVAMSTLTEQNIEDIKNKYGQAFALENKLKAPNMFDCCMDRIDKVALTIAKNGLLYNDFESAMELFNSKGFVSGDTAETNEFNATMQFVYLGRKPKPNDRLDDKESYITIW